MAENMTPNKFRQNRKALGFTQKALAYELGIHISYIYQFEKGVSVKMPIRKKLINGLKLLIADGAFMKALDNIQSVMIDKNMFGVTYEDV